MQRAERVREMKVAIIKNLYTILDERHETDASVAATALCEAALQYGSLAIGKQSALALFRNMAMFASHIPDD